MFGTFNLFWTAVPIVLTQKFGFDQREIALFALAGAGGALAAPVAGRLADRGLTRPAMAVTYPRLRSTHRRRAARFSRSA